MTDQIDVLNMSDEDILNFDPSQLENQNPPSQEETEPPTEKPETIEESPPVEEKSEEPEIEESTSEVKEIYAEESSEEVTETLETVPAEKDQIDYRQEYEKLLEPFKASGREIKVNSIDDARRLMQMGVDYAKKMQALKPHLRIMKALEKNGLLDENKVNTLIDLDKKDPVAIAAFLKEKGIDPVDISTDEVSYKPRSYAPTEQEMNLDEVLDSIRATPSYQRTIDELGNKWDQASKEVFIKNPQLISVINGHVEAGIYDQIMQIVDTERLLGRLVGLNDLEAYKQVGDALHERGAFKPQTAERKPEPNKAPQDPKRAERRKAAAPTRSAPVSGKKLDFNPLALSDDEFEKMAANYR